MQQLIAIVKEQSDKLKDVKKVDKKSLHKIEKLRDAVYAGTSKAKDCVLIVTEGDSAKSFSVSGLQTFNEEEQKYFGLYTLGGKILNVKNCTNEQLNKNDRF